MRRLIPVFLAVPFLSFALPAADDAPAVVAFTGARIHTAAGPAIENGVLVVKGGKIVAVGSAAEVKVPDGATVRDVAGKVIIPGLVDTHSHIGIFGRPGVTANADGNEGSGPVQPGLRALDAINPDDPGIRMARSGGVTTANIMPGSGNVIGGQTLYVKLRGNTVEAMRLAGGPVVGGLKMANGENPKGYGRRGQAPFTRMKVAALQREQFVKAVEYKAKWEAFRAKKGPAPETDLAMESLVEVLDRKRTVHFHCHRADDLMTAVRLSEEFGFELVLQHATEGFRVADELVKKKIPVSLTLIDSPGGKLETAGLIEENAAVLVKAGVAVAINTDDFITESRFLLRTGAIAVRGGLTEDQALTCLTSAPAKMMHLDQRLGTLAAGKDADFVVLSGAPFSIYTKVLETYIDGVKMFDRSNPRDAAYQSGGFALADPTRVPKASEVGKPPTPLEAVPAKAAADAKSELTIVFAKRIYPVSGAPITDGAVSIKDGKIVDVGPRRPGFAVPEGARVVYAAAVTPGLIDAHAVIGLTGALNVPADQDQDELSDPNQADLRAVDGFHPNEPLLGFLRDHGVTIVHAIPGRANVIAGQSGIFRTNGRTAEQMTLKTPAAVLVNFGEIPKASYPNKAPTTRMATAALVRAQFAAAQANARKRADAEEGKKPARNAKLDILEECLAGRVPVYFAAHRADDIATAIRITDEFKLKGVLTLATDGYLVTEAIAASKMPVVVHPTMQRIGSSMETMNSHLGNAAALADSKIPLAICTAFEGYVPKTRVLMYEAAVAGVNGLGTERALKAVTLDAAQILGIAERYGSLEVGKVADLVLYDGDPFENATHVTYTVMDGRIVYDRSEYLKLPFSRRALPFSEGGGVGCCLGVW